MEHFIRIVFWISTLSGFLQAKSISINDFNLKSMKKNIICPSDSTFYAPPIVTKECITTALQCVLEELDGTVRQECNADYGEIDSALEVIEKKIDEQTKEHALTNSSECACERWSQTNFTEFLKKTVTLLQLEANYSSQSD